MKETGKTYVGKAERDLGSNKCESELEIFVERQISRE